MHPQEDLLVPGSGREHTVNIIETVPANSTLTVCSPLISRPFLLIGLSAFFVENQQHQLLVYPYISPDNSLPSSLPLTGINILSLLSPTLYLSGDGSQRQFKCSISFATGCSYCKVFCNNQDAYDHIVDVQFHLELF